MGFELNKGQNYIVNDAIDWLHNSSEQVYQYAGGPGTGKSLVLNSIINRSNIDRNKIAPMSFIGAAAIVMRLKGLINAKTVHSWLLDPVNVYSPDRRNEYFDRQMKDISFRPKALGDIELIVIDEAGAVPYYLKREIESRGIKIIACGDLDQLPPVGDAPAYLYEGKIQILDEIMRQSKNSSIIYLSQRAKLGLPIHKGFYGDVLVIDEDEITNEMISRSDIILCGKNITRDKINTLVREDLLGICESLPQFREKIVCRKNNWTLECDGISLANGLVGAVNSHPDVSGFDGKTFRINFMPDMLKSSFKNVMCDYEYFNAPHDMKDKFKYSKYNHGEKFEYAYAITTHMSQGSQYANGMYMEEYLSPNINKKLNYTGITRFSNSLIYVKQKRKYY